MFHTTISGTWYSPVTVFFYLIDMSRMVTLSILLFPEIINMSYFSWYEVFRNIQCSFRWVFETISWMLPQEKIKRSNGRLIIWKDSSIQWTKLTGKHADSTDLFLNGNGTFSRAESVPFISLAAPLANNRCMLCVCCKKYLNKLGFNISKWHCKHFRFANVFVASMKWYRSDVERRKYALHYQYGRYNYPIRPFLFYELGINSLVFPFLIVLLEESSWGPFTIISIGTAFALFLTLLLSLNMMPHTHYLIKIGWMN